MENNNLTLSQMFKDAGGKEQYPDLSKFEKTITSLITRDMNKFDAISKPVWKYKQGDPKLNAAFDAYLKQIEDTVTDGGKVNLTPKGKEILETANKIADTLNFKSLQQYLMNIVLKGSGLGVVTKIEGLEKTAEKMIEGIVAEKIQSTR